MQRVVAFYEKLPRGPAPEAQPKGLIQRYQHRYMNGKNARAMRTYILGSRSGSGGHECEESIKADDVT